MKVGDYNKALFHFRGAVDEVLSIYNLYGLDVYNKEGQITSIIEKLAMQLFAQMNGMDEPIGQEYPLVSLISEEPDD